MVKKLFTYIFIYTLLVGCDTQNPLINDTCETGCYLDVAAPSLQMDGNGYYHIEWIGGYSQTFSTLSAKTGSEYLVQKVYWHSDSGIEYNGNFVSCINPASYTNNGVAQQTMGIWEEMIGDTITIYVGYYDDCGNEHKDYMRVIVEDEI